MTNNDQPLVSIIIVNYNAGELLLNCIKSILDSDYKNLEIIIVDNISTDNSHIICKEKFQQIKLIENSKNLGYCDGNNVGIKNAKGEYIVIMNPDTIVKSNWLNELFSAYKQFGEGIYQPKILSLNEKNILQSTGNMIHLFGFGYSRDVGIVDQNQRNKIEKIGYAAGTCLFTSSKIIQKIGLLDSFIFLYHDDVDFGWRASQLGIFSYYVPTSIVYHVKSYVLKWSSQKFYWLERNRKYCILTHYSKQTYKKMRLTLFLTDILVWLAYISKGFLIAKIKAEISIFKNKNIIKKRQKELEAKKIITDIELIKTFPDIICISGNSDGRGANFFNSMIRRLSIKAKNKVISEN